MWTKKPVPRAVKYNKQLKLLNSLNNLTELQYVTVKNILIIIC